MSKLYLTRKVALIHEMFASNSSFIQACSLSPIPSEICLCYISHLEKNGLERIPIGHENNDDRHAVCPIKFSSLFSRNMIKVTSKISADALVYTDSKYDLKKLKKFLSNLKKLKKK